MSNKYVRQTCVCISRSCTFNLPRNGSFRWNAERWGLLIWTKFKMADPTPSEMSAWLQEPSPDWASLAALVPGRRWPEMGNPRGEKTRWSRVRKSAAARRNLWSDFTQTRTAGEVVFVPLCDLLWWRKRRALTLITGGHALPPLPHLMRLGPQCDGDFYLTDEEAGLRG